MNTPTYLDGPYLSRRARLARRVLRAIRTLTIAASIAVAAPLIAGFVYAGYLLGTGQ